MAARILSAVVVFAWSSTDVTLARRMSEASEDASEAPTRMIKMAERAYARFAAKTTTTPVPGNLGSSAADTNKQQLSAASPPTQPPQAKPYFSLPRLFYSRAYNRPLEGNSTASTASSEGSRSGALLQASDSFPPARALTSTLARRAISRGISWSPPPSPSSPSSFSDRFKGLAKDLLEKPEVSEAWNTLRKLRGRMADPDILAEIPPVTFDQMQGALVKAASDARTHDAAMAAVENLALHAGHELSTHPHTRISPEDWSGRIEIAKDTLLLLADLDGEEALRLGRVYEAEGAFDDLLAFLPESEALADFEIAVQNALGDPNALEAAVRELVDLRNGLQEIDAKVGEWWTYDTKQAIVRARMQQSTRLLQWYTASYESPSMPGSREPHLPMTPRAPDDFHPVYRRFLQDTADLLGHMIQDDHAMRSLLSRQVWVDVATAYLRAISAGKMQAAQMILFDLKEAVQEDLTRPMGLRVPLAHWPAAVAHVIHDLEALAPRSSAPAPTPAASMMQLTAGGAAAHNASGPLLRLGSAWMRRGTAAVAAARAGAPASGPLLLSGLSRTPGSVEAVSTFGDWRRFFKPSTADADVPALPQETMDEVQGALHTLATAAEARGRDEAVDVLHDVSERLREAAARDPQSSLRTAAEAKDQLLEMAGMSPEEARSLGRLVRAREEFNEFKRHVPIAVDLHRLEAVVEFALQRPATQAIAATEVAFLRHLAVWDGIIGPPLTADDWASRVEAARRTLEAHTAESGNYPAAPPWSASSERAPGAYRANKPLWSASSRRGFSTKILPGFTAQEMLSEARNSEAWEAYDVITKSLPGSQAAQLELLKTALERVIEDPAKQDDALKTMRGLRSLATSDGWAVPDEDWTSHVLAATHELEGLAAVAPRSRLPWVLGGESLPDQQRHTMSTAPLPTIAGQARAAVHEIKQLLPEGVDTTLFDDAVAAAVSNTFVQERAMREVRQLLRYVEFTTPSDVPDLIRQVAEVTNSLRSLAELRGPRIPQQRRAGSSTRAFSTAAGGVADDEAFQVAGVLEELSNTLPADANLEPLMKAFSVTLGHPATKRYALEEAILLQNLLERAHHGRVPDLSGNVAIVADRLSSRAAILQPGMGQMRSFSTGPGGKLAADASTGEAGEIASMLKAVSERVPKSTDLRPLRNAARDAVTNPATKGKALEEVKLLKTLAEKSTGFGENFPWSVVAITKSLKRLARSADAAPGSPQKRRFSTQRRHFSTGSKTLAEEVSELLAAVAKKLPPQTNMQPLQTVILDALDEPGASGKALEKMKLLRHMADTSTPEDEAFPWKVVAIQKALKSMTTGEKTRAAEVAEMLKAITARLPPKTELRPLTEALQQNLGNPSTRGPAMQHVRQLKELAKRAHDDIHAIEAFPWRVVTITKSLTNLAGEAPTAPHAAGSAQRRSFSTLPDGRNPLEVMMLFEALKAKAPESTDLKALEFYVQQALNDDVTYWKAMEEVRNLLAVAEKSDGVDNGLPFRIRHVTNTLRDIVRDSALATQKREYSTMSDRSAQEVSQMFEALAGKVPESTDLERFETYLHAALDDLATQRQAMEEVRKLRALADSCHGVDCGLPSQISASAYRLRQLAEDALTRSFSTLPDHSAQEVLQLFEAFEGKVPASTDLGMFKSYLKAAFDDVATRGQVMEEVRKLRALADSCDGVDCGLPSQISESAHRLRELAEDAHKSSFSTLPDDSAQEVLQLFEAFEGKVPASTDLGVFKTYLKAAFDDVATKGEALEEVRNLRAMVDDCHGIDCGLPSEISNSAIRLSRLTAVDAKEPRAAGSTQKRDFPTVADRGMREVSELFYALEGKVPDSTDLLPLEDAILHALEMPALQGRVMEEVQHLKEQADACEGVHCGLPWQIFKVTNSLEALANHEKVAARTTWDPTDHTVHEVLDLLLALEGKVPESTHLGPLEMAIRDALDEPETRGHALEEVAKLREHAETCDGVSCSIPWQIFKTTKALQQLLAAAGKGPPPKGARAPGFWILNQRSFNEVSEMFVALEGKVPESTDLGPLKTVLEEALKDPATIRKALDEVRSLRKAADCADGVDCGIPAKVIQSTQSLRSAVSAATRSRPSPVGIQKRGFSTVAVNLPREKLEALRVEVIARFPGSMTASSLEALAEVALENPELQRRAMEEIDDLLATVAEDKAQAVPFTTWEWHQVLDQTSLALRKLIHKHEPWWRESALREHDPVSSAGRHPAGRRSFSTSAGDGHDDMPIAMKLRHIAEEDHVEIDLDYHDTDDADADWESSDDDSDDDSGYDSDESDSDVEADHDTDDSDNEDDIK